MLPVLLRAQVEISELTNEISQQVLPRLIFLKHNIPLMLLNSTESDSKCHSYVEMLCFATPKGGKKTLKSIS